MTLGSSYALSQQSGAEGDDEPPHQPSNPEPVDDTPIRVNKKNRDSPGDVGENSDAFSF